jgi:acetylornithine deacetylase/succinyl-diaminopimelate desuccinylase-like protein
MVFSMPLFEDWFVQHETQIREEFFHFLRFPSISTNEAHEGDCIRTAHWLVSYLQRIGMQAELWDNPGKPVVFAEKKCAQAPTVLLYQHYDVQPVDPLDLWNTKPFDPVFREGKVFARGASDNKGQCFLTLTALKAIQELAPHLPLYIKIFIEGEEESGGEGTHIAIQQNTKRLKADFLGVIDFDIPSKETPALSMGYRGILAVQIECKNAGTDLHSGVHGGVALNPNRILIELLSQLWDDKGRVAIPHFYDRITPYSPEERAKIDFSFDEARYRKEFGVGALCREEGVSPREANWLRPTVEINGIWGGYTGPGFKTVIPAKAFAKLSCRLVPDQDPEEIFKHLEAFLLQKAPKGVELQLEWHHGAKAYHSSFSSPFTQAASKSLEEVFQKKPCSYTLCGGSVPIVRDLATASQAEVSLLGFALATDNVHAPNEHFEWECFKKGFMTMVRLLFELSNHKMDA